MGIHMMKPPSRPAEPSGSSQRTVPATRRWMQALYDARLTRHLDTADSVRAASIAILTQRRAAHLSTHPFYWAAFVAAGDWR